MKRMYCEYCGQPLSEGCDCQREAAEAREQFIEDYENSPETLAGWRNQDLIENSHFYNR